MHRKLPREFGLVTGTLLWTSLTAWVLLDGTGPGLNGQSTLQARPTNQFGATPGSGTPYRRVGEGAALRFDRADQALAEQSARQAVARLGATTWHRNGVRGQGVKVAILDSGFQGYRKALGSALPRTVKVQSFRRDENLEARDSQHGILCAEIIHRLAPDAELLFANWEPEQPDRFLEAVRWARREGARVISCSIIMPTWSDGEGGGKNHEVIRQLLGPGTGPGDGLFFASAGNTALRHWGGPFRPGREGWHEWATGQKENPVKPLGKERVSVELCAPPGAAFELVVRDTALDREVGRGITDASSPGNCVAVRFDPQWGHDYAARVRQVPPPGSVPGTQPTSAPFHLVVLGGRLQYATARGSIPFPGDGTEVVAVGAVDASGRRMSYSSCGPNSPQPKPDFVATVPFPSVWRAEQAFAGTSAAAPQAAGLAALIWSKQPNWTASQVNLELRKAARRPDGSRHDFERGFGQVRLP